MMEESGVKRVVTFWKKEICDHIEQYNKYNVSHQLKQMAALFTPGLFYYYIMNFHNLEIDFVHKGTKDVLGVEPEDFNMQILLGMLPEEELKMLEKKESLAADFLFRYLNPGELTDYKVVYFFKVIDVEGNLHTMLHQATTLTVSGTGKVEHVLGVQTDVSHLGLAKTDKVSFINLNGGKSYFNMDPLSNATFNPEDSKELGELRSVLSAREKEVVKLFSEGFTSGEVADLLKISEHTVRTHRKKILEKSGCANMTELVARCLVEGVI